MAEAQFETGAWYHCRVEEVRFEESGGSSTPGITIKWMVCDGSELDGKFIYDQRWISAKNVARQAKDMLILGFDIKKRPLRFMPKELPGKEADVQAKIEEFPKDSGNWSVKVGRVKPPGAGGEDNLIAKLEAIIGNDLREQEATGPEPFEKQF